MELSGVKPECRCKAFKKSPHFFKPLQVITSIASLICTVFLSFRYTEPLWETALACLLISGAATTLFVLGIQHNFVKRYSCALLTWNAVEFLYSLILTICCGFNVGFAIDRATWDFYENGVQLIILIVLFLFLTISYGASVVYIGREELRILMEKQNVPMGKTEEVVNKAEYINDLEKFLEH